MAIDNTFFRKIHIHLEEVFKTNIEMFIFFYKALGEKKNKMLFKITFKEYS